MQATDRQIRDYLKTQESAVKVKISRVDGEIRFKRDDGKGWLTGAWRSNYRVAEDGTVYVR